MYFTKFKHEFKDKEEIKDWLRDTAMELFECGQGYYVDEGEICCKTNLGYFIGKVTCEIDPVQVVVI